MRGFLLGALALIALDVVLRAPASRLTGALTPVTALVQRWMDPAVPLIGPGHLAGAVSGVSLGAAGAGAAGGLLGAVGQGLANPVTGTVIGGL